MIDKSIISTINLHHLRVLVTRPKPQGEALCQFIQECNGEAIYFPTIDIVAKKIESLPFSHDDPLTWIIFISPQAVCHAAHLLPLPLPPSLKIATVGLGTAKALEERGIPVAVYPEQEWSSEGLLQLPEFQNIAGKKAIIVRGEGGREVLAQALTSKGAIVTHVIAYQRVLPKVNIKRYTHLLREHKIDIIVSTSLEGINNLLQLLGGKNRLYLQSLPLVVISDRLKESAKSLGFTQVMTAKNASHESILEVLSREKGRHMKTEETKQRIRWTNVGILFSMIGVVALAAALYFIYGQFSTLYVNLSQATSSLQKGFEKNLQLSGEIPQQLQQIQAEQSKQAQIMNGLHPGQSRILLAQSNVKLANEQLQLMQNVSLAEKLLQAANDEIKNLADPNLQNVRKVLAADITRLQGVQTVNKEDAYLRLVAIGQKIDQLPLIVQQVNSPTNELKPDASAPWWKKGLEQTWKTLQKIVVVQHAPRQIPLLTPEQRQFLFLNLHAKLETATWGLLHHQTVIYQTSLAEVTSWIKSYFVQDAPITQSVLTSLADLQKLNIQLPALTVNDSLQAFQAYLQGSV